MCFFLGGEGGGVGQGVGGVQGVGSGGVKSFFFRIGSKFNFENFDPIFWMNLLIRLT